MLRTLDDLQRRLSGTASVSETVDAAMAHVLAAGFDAMIYDYSPVATTPEGRLLSPSHLSHRNVPPDMRALWCERGYHQRDPVQQLSLRRAMPFAWSYRRNDRSTDLGRHITGEHAPVSDYLHDAGLTCGVTAPVHRPDGGFATLTAIVRNASASFAEDCRPVLLEFGLLGQMVHEQAYPRFARHERKSCSIRLTRRERECLRYAAEGLTAKEIAQRIRRSVPTATLHLKSAAEKLGARNRIHAVTLAMHYRLLDL